MASLGFLRQILSGEKNCLELNRVRFVEHCERYPELEIGSLLEYAREHVPGCFNYLPDDPDDHTKIDRGYLLNVQIRFRTGLKYTGTRSYYSTED